MGLFLLGLAISLVPCRSARSIGTLLAGWMLVQFIQTWGSDVLTTGQSYLMDILLGKQPLAMLFTYPASWVRLTTACQFVVVRFVAGIGLDVVVDAYKGWRWLKQKFAQ